MAKKKQEEGFGLGFLAAVVGSVAAGFYLYGAKDGKNARVKIRAWTLKAKAEVLEKFEKMQEVTEESYQKTVDTVTAKYAKLKDVGEEEAGKLNLELKRHWKEIQKAITAKEGKKK